MSHMKLNLYDKTKWYLALQAPVILVSRIFAVNQNEHVSRNPFMHELLGSVFWYNFVMLVEYF